VRERHELEIASAIRNYKSYSITVIASIILRKAGKNMVCVEDKTTVTVSKDTQEWLNLLKLELQAAKKQQLSQDDIVRLALGCLEQHKALYKLARG
jgi:DNA-binding transcriptional regulator YhcF (GntR family)